MLPFKKCDGCNKDLPLGSTKYSVRIEVSSDFDGFLPDDEAEDTSEAINALIDEINDLSAEELEEDIHFEVEMTLCRECRNRFVEQVESYMDGGIINKEKERPSLH